MVCNNKAAVDSFKIAVKRTLKNKLNHKISNKRFAHELHAASVSLPIKKYFYRQIKSQEWCLYTVVLSKPRVYDYLTNKAGRKKLYNYLANFLLHEVDLSLVSPTVTMVVDKCKNKAELESNVVTKIIFPDLSS